MFDELKIKNILKREINFDEYKALSTNIQKDERVVEHLLKCEPSSIGKLVTDIDISKYVLDDYSLLAHLNKMQLNEIFSSLDLTKVKITKDMFDLLSNKNQFLIFKQSPKECLDFFDDTKRFNLIENIISAKINNYPYISMYDIFTEEELKEFILSLREKDFIYLSNSSKKIKEYITNMIDSLQEEDLINLYKKNNHVSVFLTDKSKDAIGLQLAFDNFHMINDLTEEAQLKFYMKNPRFLRFASDEVIQKYFDLQDEITCDDYVFMIGYNVRYDVLLKCSKKELNKAFSYDINNLFWYCNLKRNNLALKDIIFDSLDRIELKEKKEKLKKIFEQLREDKIVPPKKCGIIYSEKYQIAKLLLEEKVIMNNEPELIQRYIETYDSSILLEMLTNTYGEHIRDIMSNRPNFSITNIETLSILSPDIYKKLGKGFVLYTLNCNLRSSNYLIYQLANDNELLEIFTKYLNCMTENIEKLNINTISNLVDKFMLHRDLLKEIDYDNLIEERKKNIELFLSDMFEITSYITTLDDIDNYIEIRNKRFEEYLNGLEYAPDVRDCIFAYVTGRDVFDRGQEYSLENLTVEQVIKIFNIENIINNEELIKKMNLNKDDIALLLLLHEISNIKNLDVLKDTFKAIVNKGMSSNLLSSTFDKIKEYFVEDVKEKLISKSIVENMKKELIEGVEVVSFEGDGFSLLTSVTGLNLSNNNSIPTPLCGKELLESWLNTEDGTVTISAGLVSSDTSIYPTPMWSYLTSFVTFVFDSNVEIVGMGGSDISSSHNPRAKRYAFNYIMDNDFKFSSMEELKNTININNRKNRVNTKFDSEITLARYRDDVRTNSTGNRVMPMGIYVIGEITPEILETAKVFNDYYEKKGLGKFRIIRINPNAYQRGGINSCNSMNKRGDEVNGKVV